MTFWQIIALIFLIVCTVIGLVGLLIFRRELRKENEINEKHYQIEQERFERESRWHDQEALNWRQIDPALQKRIKELEATCKRNQNTIAGLKYELSCKNEFLSTFKLKDLYEQRGGFIFDEEEV